MQKLLNKIEIDKIEKFCKDEVLYNAVKKVLLKTLYNSGVVEKEKIPDVRNGAFNMVATAYQTGETITNERLGERLRALYEGVHELENGFAELKTIKIKPKEEEETPNNAI